MGSCVFEEFNTYIVPPNMTATTIFNTLMIRSLFLFTVVTLLLGFATPTLAPSGSIGTGPGQISPRKAYAQGKSLTFKVLACRGCPIPKSEMDRDRAMSLAASLEAVYAEEETGTQDDEIVKGLCGPDTEEDDCGIRMEVVHYFLTRRYKLETPVRGIQNDVIDEG